MMFTCTLLVFVEFLSGAYCTLQAYTGTEPTTSVSPLFTVKLTQGSTTISPHVYYGKIQNSYLPSNINDLFKDRTISWIEFGQQSSDTTQVEVTVKNNDALFNTNTYPVRILPLSYNIGVTVTNSDRTATFKISGQFKHMSLEYGNNDNGLDNSNNSSFKNSILIFAGGLSPPINKSSDDVVYFGPGVHNITGQGGKSILKTSKNTIYFDRGSYVYGKIDFNGGSGIANIIGYGILDAGTYFDYNQRKNNSIDSAWAIQGNRPINLYGLTVYNPSNLVTGTLPHNSQVRAYKMMGWYYNNDGMGLAGNSNISDSFIRTNDDSLKISYAGSDTIICKRIVIWQSFNGGAFQLGWNGSGCNKCKIIDSDILHAEWQGYNAGINGQGNDAVIDMNEADNAQFNSLLIDDIRVDTKVGRIIALTFQNVNNGGYVQGLNVSNWNIREDLQWFDSKNPPENFLQIVNSDGSYMKNINFNNVQIKGKMVTSSSQSGWNLKTSGNIQDVKYS
eukprot:204647_1